MRMKWLTVGFSALAIALLLHSAAIARHFHQSSKKVGVLISGPRTQPGDNYYYYSMLRHASERLTSSVVRSGEPAGGDHRIVNTISNSYAAALYASYAIYQVAAWVTPSSRDALLVTSILNTALLALSFLVFLMILLGGSFSGGLLTVGITLVGLVFVDAFGNSFYFGRPFWADDLLTYSSNPTRFVNPSMFWAIGLAAATFQVRWLQTGRPRFFWGAILLTGLTGMASISVGATLVMALGLSVLFEVLIKRVMPWRLISIALAGLAGVAWGYLQLRAHAATSLGQELRHGEFLGLVVGWQFLLLIFLIPVIWRWLEKERVFVAALVVAATLIGMFCDSYNLGSRLWVRGAVIFAWSGAVFCGARIFFAWGSSHLKGRKQWLWWPLSLIPALLICALVLQIQKPNFDAWNGFVEREKWELLNWIDTHLPSGSIVASEDIEDSYLLPLYSRSKPLFTMYGLTQRTHDEELRHYFYNMSLFERDQSLLAAVLRLNQNDAKNYTNYLLEKRPVPLPYRGEVADAIIFLELVVYSSYVRGISNALVDAKEHRQLEAWLRRCAKEARHANYALDFVIVENIRLPLPKFSQWSVVYKNDQYSLLKNPH